jgi:hypothetical protein
MSVMIDSRDCHYGSRNYPTPGFTAHHRRHHLPDSTLVEAI